MFAKSMSVILGLIVASPLWAFDCYLTAAKGSCWKNYKVTIEAVDVETFKVLTTITIPKGKDWVREAFVCEPSQRITYKAQITPEIWEQNKGKVYKPYKFLTLPAQVKPGENAWVASVCFSTDFNDVSLPPDAGQHCACDFASIPPVPPKKIP